MIELIVFNHAPGLTGGVEAFADDPARRRTYQSLLGRQPARPWRVRTSGVLNVSDHARVAALTATHHWAGV
jgi:hypothetical protein